MNETTNEAMETVEQSEKVILMAVAFDAKKNLYYVDLARGSNAAETAFAMSVVIKCLLKDNVITKPEDITDLVNKYLNDPQYAEVKPDETEELEDEGLEGNIQ